MKVFESEIYAINGRGCLPFKIVIEEMRDEDKKMLEIKKIEYILEDDEITETNSILMSTFWTEEQPQILGLSCDEYRGSALMFDFGSTFLDIMENGGKTVLLIYDENLDDSVYEVWSLNADKYVCEEKHLSYTLDEFIGYMDDENCDNIDVYLNDELKIVISST